MFRGVEVECGCGSCGCDGRCGNMGSQFYGCSWVAGARRVGGGLG